MSNDPAAGDGVPDPLREWLAGMADEQGLSEEELVGRLLAGDAGLAGVDVDGDELRAHVEELDATVEELETVVSGLESDLDEKIRDVRERVIQVKREADTKAPADHAHEPIEADVDRIGNCVESLGRDLVDLAERLEAVDERMAGGFENYEAILEYLVEAVDDVDGKLTTLARATVDARERLDRLSRAEARRAAVDDLRETAHRHGVSSADCSACGRSVDLGLLSVPECPDCAARITELEPRRGFFRSSVLHAGERPALEGEIEGAGPDLDPLVSGEGLEPPTMEEWSEASPAAEEGEPDAARWVELERAGEPDPDTPTEWGDGEDTAGSGAPEEPVTAVSGVGDAYAAELDDAGVETVDDLARAEPATLADRTDIPAGRLDILVDRARQRLEGE